MSPDIIGVLPSILFDKSRSAARSRSLIAVNSIRKLPGILQIRGV